MLVQNFTELPLEDIFVVLIFAIAIAACGTVRVPFNISRFLFSCPIREKRESLHHAKISRYTRSVVIIILQEIGVQSELEMVVNSVCSNR